MSPTQSVVCFSYCSFNTSAGEVRVAAAAGTREMKTATEIQASERRIARPADQAGHRAIEMGEELLADRPLAVERLLVPARLVEPHQRGRQINKRNPPRARHLQRRQRPV